MLSLCSDAISEKCEIHLVIAMLIEVFQSIPWWTSWAIYFQHGFKQKAFVHDPVLTGFDSLYSNAIRRWRTPCCQLASVILPVCSVAHKGNWVASVALDLLCDRAYSFAHQNRSSWAAVSCSLAIERVQSQTELLRWLWLKKVGKFPRHDEANE